MSLSNQTQKANKLNPVICLQNGVGHKTIIAMRSDTDPTTNYEVTLQPTTKRDGVIIYTINCQKITGTGMECCKGSLSTKSLCKHELAAIKLAVASRGKSIHFRQSLCNARKRKGIVVQFINSNSTIYGIVS